MFFLDGRSYGLTLKKLQEKVSQSFIVVSGVFNNISKVHQNVITENVKISRWPPPVLFLTDLSKNVVKFDCTAL